MQGRWLIHIARYTSVLLALVVASLLTVKPQIAWVLVAIVPWLMLAARAIWHRSLLRALHRGLGSVMALLASAVTLLAAILFVCMLMSMDWRRAFGFWVLGSLATTVSAYLFEIASFDARYDEAS